MLHLSLWGLFFGSKSAKNGCLHSFLRAKRTHRCENVTVNKMGCDRRMYIYIFGTAPCPQSSFSGQKEKVPAWLEICVYEMDSARR